MEGLGGPQGMRSLNTYDYVPGGGDPGRVGGGTYTNPRGDGNRDPTIQDYENIFGPAARDIKMDMQRGKRHARWHLPDVLRGSNTYLADRIDGLITDTTSSPFTTVILPYKYIENVDQKIKWNAWSFDEGLASRVPYESAARTLTQTKRSYAGYTIRHGLAITMEHNFMMSEKGRENFKNQLQQVVGSIQYTNDLDVHIALITAVSYAKERAEKYYTTSKTNHQIIREYIDLFGFMSKNPNAMDIMIEEAKAILRTWGAAEPNFLLTNSKLTFQMTMIPEKTQYLTQGPDGVRKLREGPNIGSYRGLKIINSRAFSMEEGAPPRDVLRRRVRVAEYYRIPYEQNVEQKSFAFYDESKDAWQKFSWHDLYRMSLIGDIAEQDGSADWDDEDAAYDRRMTKLPSYGLTNVGVDVYMTRALFEHMTVGEYRGNFRDGFVLEDTGNLVLNPWYALCGVRINGRGLEVPTIGADGAFLGRLAAGNPRNPDHLQLRRTQVAAVAGGAGPHPEPGTDYVDVQQRSEYMFKKYFPNVLRAFGYNGEMDFTKKSAGATAIFAAAAAGGGLARADEYAKGEIPVTEAVEVDYNNILNDPVCVESLRGQPDYNDYTYQQARINFDRYLKLYLSGRGDVLPSDARKFFDQFNWQRFNVPDNRKTNVFAILLSRIYNTGRPPFHPYHGMEAGGPIQEVADALERASDAEREDIVAAGGDTSAVRAIFQANKRAIRAQLEHVQPKRYELVVIRPNIEHNMLGIIMGRGGLDELGATFWGQTELSCYDDSMHGIWGMSYKYNEKSIVLNHKNLIRLWDVAYDGYNGGKDCTHVCWTDPISVSQFKDDTYEINKPYEGASMMVMAFENVEGTDPWPSPVIFHDPGYKNSGATMPVDGENAQFIKVDPFRIFNRPYYQEQYKNYFNLMPDFSKMHNTKSAGSASEENEAQSCALAFQGTMKIYPPANSHAPIQEISGSGHHGTDYVGVASVRSGKGMRMGPMQDQSIVKIM